MNKLAGILGIVVLALVGIFGYFLHKSNWDFVLAKGMIGYEIGQLINGNNGDNDPYVNTQNNSPTQGSSTQSDINNPEDAEAAPQSTEPSQVKSSHSKDSIYKGDGNSFSDIKRRGDESAVTLSSD